MAEEPPSVFINGKQLYTQYPPVMENDRTLVPLRVIFEAFNQRVSWNMDDQSITSGNIWLQIGNSLAKVGDRQVNLDAPAVIIDDRTYVPLRFISESLGKKVTWDSGNNKINIDDDTYRLKLKSAKELIESNSSGYERIANEVLTVWGKWVDRQYENPGIYLDKDTMSKEYSNIYNNLTSREKNITDLLSSLSHPNPDNLEAYNILNDYYKTYCELKNLATSPGGSYTNYSQSFNDVKNRLGLIRARLNLILN